MGSHDNAHTHRSGHAAAELAILARSPYRAAGPSFWFVLTSSMHPGIVPKGPGKLLTAHLHVQRGDFSPVHFQKSGQYCRYEGFCMAALLPCPSLVSVIISPSFIARSTVFFQRPPSAGHVPDGEQGRAVTRHMRHMPQCPKLDLFRHTRPVL